MPGKRRLGENPLDLLVPSTSTSKVATPDADSPAAAPPRSEKSIQSDADAASGEPSEALAPGDDAPFKRLRARPGQYLSFYMCDEEYCAQIGKVVELVELGTLTKVPKTPKFVLGVMNLRGNVVPIIDLRIKFSLGPPERGERSCVVMVETELEEEPVLIGLLVDGANRVETFEEDALEPTPAFGSKIHLDYLLGVARREDDFLLILDIDRILTLSELESTELAVAAAEIEYEDSPDQASAKVDASTRASDNETTLAPTTARSNEGVQPRTGAHSTKPEQKKAPRRAQTDERRDDPDASERVQQTESGESD